MGKSDKTLLDEIEAAVLSDMPLADALRKCVVLGGRSGSAALRDWATRELRGYPPEAELPEYRRLSAPLFVDAVTGNTFVQGQRIGVHELPDVAQETVKEEVPITQGIGEMEAVVANATGNMIKISPPGAAILTTLMNHENGVPYQQIVELYWQVHVSAVHGLIDGVRTTLAELVAEMRAGTPAGQELPSEQVADQAVAVAVHGNGNRVTVVHSSDKARVDASVGEGSEGPWWRSAKALGAAVVGIATILATYFAWLALPH